ncbi:hypothetical protein ACWCL1_08360 [Ligilactobacillus sp. LYQ135]
MAGIDFSGYDINSIKKTVKKDLLKYLNDQNTDFVANSKRLDKYLDDTFDNQEIRFLDAFNQFLDGDDKYLKKMLA